MYKLINVFRYFLILNLFLMIFASCKKEKDKQILNDDTLMSFDKNKHNPNTTYDNESIIMLTDIGQLHRDSFFYETWRGLMRASRDFDIKITYIESRQSLFVQNQNIKTANKAKPGLVMGIGYGIADTVYKTALENPEQKYAMIDKFYDEGVPENMIAVSYRSEEASFLAGVVAAMKSKTKKIAFIGGMKLDVIDRFEYGFKAGVNYIDPKATVYVKYLDTFTNAKKGNSVAKSLYNNDVDVIFHAAGASGIGVIEAAQSMDKMVIGVDSDQNFLAPANVITSVLKNVNSTAYKIAKSIKDDTFEGGLQKEYGLSGDGVDIVYSPLLSDDITKKVKQVRELIINGEIKCPKSELDYEYIQN